MILLGWPQEKTREEGTRDKRFVRKTAANSHGNDGMAFPHKA